MTDSITLRVVHDPLPGVPLRMQRGRHELIAPVGRFVYVNAGTYAGAPASPWARRAKIPLGAITGASVAAVRADAHAVLCAEISGRARDGGPAAGTVTLQGRGWAVASERG